MTTTDSTITDADQLAALPNGSVVTRGRGLYVAFDGSLWNNGLPWSPAEVLRHGRTTPVKLLHRPDWPSQAELHAAVTAALDDLNHDGLCAFWACPGPDEEPVHMATCGVCSASRSLPGSSTTTERSTTP